MEVPLTVPKPCDPMRLPTSGSSLDMATGNDMEAASMTSSGTNTVVFKSFESLDDLRSVRSPRQAPLLPSDRPLEGEAPQWSAQHSRELYNVNGWGCGYYGITEGGDLTVHPLGESGPCVNVPELVSFLQQREGLSTPLILRFPTIACHRLEALGEAFRSAIERFEYQGAFRSVFPVKSNPDRELLSSLLAHSASRGRPLGLEVGSKSELAMALSLLPASDAGLTLVCNGFKDAEYMELALRAEALGANAIVVMEQFSEVRLALDAARRLGVRPRLGLRACLGTRHGGHWGSTTGDGAKFGLRPREIVATVARLREAGLLDALRLLHFHAGSQISHIRMVKEVVREAAYMYAELVKMGAGSLSYLDVGGGLGVDYDGSFTDSEASVSYSLQAYANDIVSSMQEVCVHRGIPAPTLLSESGRAVASHATLVLFDVLDRPTEADELRCEEEEVVDSVELDAGAPLTGQLRAAARRGKGRFLLTTFKEVLDSISADAWSLRECYSDACYFREDALRAFKLGVLSLEERAKVDVMFDAACERIRALAREHALPLPDALTPAAGGGAPSSRPYHVNLSVFRSAVDAWGIHQVFPILPITRLAEEPRVRATLGDVTCDSDGRIDHFINPCGGPALPALPLHELRAGERYVLALCLGGVYQEVMGSVHNMFGRLNTAVVWADAAGGVAVRGVARGETSGEVLRHAGHDERDMVRRVRAAAAERVERGLLGAEAAQQFMRCYEERMAGYTYMV